MARPLSRRRPAGLARPAGRRPDPRRTALPHESREAPRPAGGLDGRQASGPGCRPRGPGDAPHAASLIRDASPGGGRRPADRSGVARACEYLHDPAVHPPQRGADQRGLRSRSPASLRRSSVSMPNFTASLLSSGERIVIERRQHWIVLLDHAKVAILGLVVALLILIFRGNLGNDGFGGTINSLLGWVVLALVVFAVVVFVYQYLRWLNEGFIVTNRRVIQIGGILNKKALDSSLEKINDAVLSESLFGRAFGFGDLEILTASETGIERMHMLVDAAGFKRAISDAKHELELEVSSGRIPSPAMRAGGETYSSPAAEVDSAPAPAPAASVATPAAPSSADVANAIDRLKQLLD